MKLIITRELCIFKMPSYTYRRGHYYLKNDSPCGGIIIALFILGCGFIAALLQNIGIMMVNYTKQQQLNRCANICSTTFRSVEYEYTPQQLTNCSNSLYNKFYKK